MGVVWGNVAIFVEGVVVGAGAGARKEGATVVGIGPILGAFRWEVRVEVLYFPRPVSLCSVAVRGRLARNLEC